MRPYIGMVSERTESISPGRPEWRRAVIPRSESARLIDFVKLRGVLEASRISKMSCQKVLQVFIFANVVDRAKKQYDFQNQLGKYKKERRGKTLGNYGTQAFATISIR